jgi:predicted tellurium resistance membrane protein TerC
LPDFHVDIDFWSLHMELFSTPWWSALLAIILIDLVLAGDNAIVIALAARSLPKHLQKKAIAWGTVGAIAVWFGCCKSQD